MPAAEAGVCLGVLAIGDAVDGTHTVLNRFEVCVPLDAAPRLDQSPGGKRENRLVRAIK